MGYTHDLFLLLRHVMYSLIFSGKIYFSPPSFFTNSPVFVLIPPFKIIVGVSIVVFWNVLNLQIVNSALFFCTRNKRSCKTIGWEDFTFKIGQLSVFQWEKHSLSFCISKLRVLLCCDRILKHKL